MRGSGHFSTSDPSVPEGTPWRQQECHEGWSQPMRDLQPELKYSAGCENTMRDRSRVRGELWPRKQIIALGAYLEAPGTLHGGLPLRL
jgi:hypothetical protein